MGAAVFTAVGLGLTAISSISQGIAASKAADFQAAVARNNQILADRAAEDALLRGEAAVADQALATKQFKARQRVAQAGAGQVVDAGSALDLTADTAAVGKLNELRIRANAEREALSFRTQGANFASEAELARLRGAGAKTAGFLGAAGTLLTGADKLSAGFTALFPKKVPTI